MLVFDQHSIGVLTIPRKQKKLLPFFLFNFTDLDLTMKLNGHLW